MKPMKGARALASAVLVLGGVSAMPAVSAAQDPTTPTTTTTPGELSPPGGSGVAVDPGASHSPADAPPVGAAAGDPREAVTDSVETTTDIRRGAPADAPTGGAHVAASTTVTMGDFFFSPSSVTVAVGDTVTWRNTGQAPHNATADDGSFKTPDLNNGGSASHTFNTSGTFSYICTIHPNMHGSIRVLASSGGGGGSRGAGSGSSGSSQSETSAVASPTAAGTSTSLPATGLAAGALALAGLAMLAGGIALRRLDPLSRR
jgi:plastocyanin